MKLYADDDLVCANQKTLRECAAAYVRMSTEHQQYSTCNQMEVIRGFARQRNWEVVKEYSDEGRSGLKIQGRAALSQMIGDVLTRQVNFGHILVYDVSRWGRFQDPDEAAHYEFLCREAGVAVHYCAEPFENNGCLTSTIAKSFKRAMAGEYSRELSTKVFQGATRMIQLGYKQGGRAAYGLRRMLVDQSGQPKTLLKLGEQKNLQTDRVIYVPGPTAEIEVVRWIFETFAVGRQGATAIARRLNERGLVLEAGKPWQGAHIRHLLRNENYIGNLVYSRTSIKLGGPRVVNPADQWVRKENAFAAVVSRELFFKARDNFAANRKKYELTDDDLLASLRKVLAERGRLSGELVRKLKQPHPKAFRNHFGSILIAYRLIGFDPHLNCGHFEITRRLEQITRELIDRIIRQIENMGATATWNERSQVLLVNDELRVGVVFARHCVTYRGSSRWVLRSDARPLKADLKPDLTMAVRMDRHNQGIHDYYLLPGMRYPKKKMRLAEQNGVYLDAYRFRTLDFLVGMAARVKFS